MAVGKFIENIRNANKLKGPVADKIAAFFTLLRIHIKFIVYRNKKEIVKESFAGYNIVAYDYLTLDFLIYEIFLTNEYAFQPADDKPLIIDCGANIGMSILYFKKYYPGSKIIAFEANPNAYRLLEKNISSNNIQNVELHNVALFDKETELSFYISDQAGTLTGSLNPGRGGSRELKIKAQKLSAYLKQFASVDLIKMDVEGAEINIINDLVESQEINKARQYIIEYHHNVNDAPSALSEFLKIFEDNGFNYNIRADFKNIQTFQDILIHFYK